MSREVAELVRSKASACFPSLAAAFADAHVVCGLRPFTADGALIIGTDDTVT